ncbi:MAG: T9SS type A sorting domain-containing protein, partial [Duncaniella sp.]|nr:T9SS type A sorting domain-containing protein [Duncaniella sp.]
VNVEGEYDFKIFGNAIRSDRKGDGGSSEPGIVMVSVDVNGNGIADDPWYELAGSEYNAATTFHNYRITYYRPEKDKVATPDPDNSAITDDTYIRWTSNDPEAPSGYVLKNSFHRQSYWPEWSDEEEMTFEGTRLADNAYDYNGEVVMKFLPWGYVDNRPNAEDLGFKLDWAVDDEGKAVSLTHADFFKVYTAINAEHGRIGEISTEVSGGQDLHPEAEMSSVDEIRPMSDSFSLLACGNGVLSLLSDARCKVSVYSASGICVKVIDLMPGRNDIDVSGLSQGVYIVTDGVKSVKVVI